jgi:tRNA A37 threonylcarbamoyladenosine dehydratase
MTNSILVSLVSQQTIPNVELIKEFGDKINKHLFITTAQMQNQLEWIKQASGIGISDVIEVDAFDTLDIKKKLGEYPFGDDEIIVNVTGGTKLMSLVIDDFFRSVGATIYYVTGYNKEFIK